MKKLLLSSCFLIMLMGCSNDQKNDPTESDAKEFLAEYEKMATEEGLSLIHI